MASSPHRRDRALVALAAVASHATALAAGFVWLDHAHVEERAALANGGFVDLFTHGFAGTGFYRPLMSVSLSIDALLGGPFVFHATSLVWHAVASIATAAAGEALGLRRRAATLAALLFAVHPLSSLVADAVAFRSEAMLAAFLLGFVWAHVARRPALAAAFVFAGCMTKETAYGVLPLFVAALETTTARTAERRRAMLSAEAVAFGAAAAIRLAYAPAFRARHAALGASDAIGTRAAALAKSAAAMFFPIDRTICDAFRVTPAWHPAALAGVAFAAAAAYFAWKRRGPALLFALALLPSLQLVPIMRWWSPHYLYVPAAFAAMLVAELVDARSDRTVHVAWVAAAALGVVTLVDGRRYATDASLWTPEVAAQPACLEGQFYLGEVDREARRWDAAAAHYEAALAPRPRVLAYVDRGAALENLGAVRLEQHRFDDARAAFRTALEGTADANKRRELLHDLAAAALEAGDAAEADRILTYETARPDAMRESLVVRAMALRRLGRDEEAADLLARARAGAR